jgi:hypothetical protein
VERNLVDGLKHWNELETKLKKQSDRDRLASLLIPLAAETIWFEASKPNESLPCAAILSKLVTVASDAQWRSSAAQLVLAWQLMRTNNPSPQNIQMLDGPVLQRLLENATDAPLEKLLETQANDKLLLHIFDTQLDRILSLPLPSQGYIGSHSSEIVAAAVRKGDITSAINYISKITLANPQITSLVKPIQNALHLISESSLTKVAGAIACFDGLSDNSWQHDPSARQIKSRLCLIGYLAARDVSTNGLQDEGSLIVTTKTIKGARDYWSAVELGTSPPVEPKIASPAATHSTTDFDLVIIPLAAAYEKAFNDPGYQSQLLIRHASAATSFSLPLWRRTHWLQQAYDVAPTSVFRLSALKGLINAYIAAKDYDQGRAALHRLTRDVTPKYAVDLALLESALDNAEQTNKQITDTMHRAMYALRDPGT